MSPRSVDVAPDRCVVTRGPSADTEPLAGLATGFAALADPVRLQLFETIALSGTTGVCVCDLQVSVDRSQPTVSHHLRVLREAGLVTADKRGRWVWYQVATPRLEELTQMLGQLSHRPRPN